MQVVIQSGVHTTEHERLLKCLLRNKEDFARRGIAVPGPGRYRPLLKETLAAMDVSDPAPDARDIVLEEILDNQTADRLILSNTHLFGVQRDAIGDQRFYPLAHRKIEQMDRLFAYDDLEIFMAIRNPATFLPSVLTGLGPARIRGILQQNDAREFRWAELFGRIRQAAPDVAVTVWCNEDAPLIWGQIIREIAGLEPGTKVVGGFSLLSSIMTDEGMQRFRAYLHKNAGLNEMNRRRVIAAFLDKYAKADEIEEEIDLPGWTDEMVQNLTEIYDEDVLDIQRLPGVQVITP